MKLKRKDVIGYIRISTHLQAQDPRELQTQEGKLIEACARNRFNLIAVHEDVASAAVPGSAGKRPGLMEALTAARQRGLPVIVTDATRLFRNPQDARKHLYGAGIRVFSVKENRFLKAKEIYDRAAHGANQAVAIREGTSKAMIAQGAAGPTIEQKARGRRRSMITRKTKADERVLGIVKLLRRDVAYEALSYRALADLLNRNGITTARGKKWTKENVRNDALRAKKELARERDQATLAPLTNQDMEDPFWFANMF
jgi:DNA invertase Pin-like site-specific DNA recombinase